VVEQLSPAASDPTLRDSILPRTPEGWPDRLQSEISYGHTDCLSELAVPIMNQEPVILAERKGFA
jgi:hypothetical protein